MESFKKHPRYQRHVIDMALQHKTMTPQFNLKIGDTTLKLAELSDADFILELRTDEALNTYISKTDTDVSAQLEWLANYKKLEATNEEYYFIVKYQSVPVGTIRLYDFKDEAFCIGSWIIKKGTPHFASIASFILAYQAAFETLKFKTANLDVRKGNKKVIQFHNRWGAVPLREDDLNVYFTLSYYDYSKNVGKFRRFT